MPTEDYVSERNRKKTKVERNAADGGDAIDSNNVNNEVVVAGSHKSYSSDVSESSNERPNAVHSNRERDSCDEDPATNTQDGVSEMKLNVERVKSLIECIKEDIDSRFSSIKEDIDSRFSAWETSNKCH
jgi:hypothetical protein